MPINALLNHGARTDFRRRGFFDRVRGAARRSWTSIASRLRRSSTGVKLAEFAAAMAAGKRRVRSSGLDFLPQLYCAAITSVESDIENDQKSDINNPAMLPENARNEAGGSAISKLHLRFAGRERIHPRYDRIDRRLGEQTGS